MDTTQVNSVGQAKFKILLGAICVWLFACISIMAAVPQVYSPFSMPVAIPALIVSTLELSPILTIVFGAFPLVLTFTVCVSKGLLTQISGSLPEQDSSLYIGNIAAVLVTFSALLSVLVNALSFQHGLQYHGLFHTLMIYSVNLFCILCLPVMYWRHFSKKSVSTYLSFYTFYFSWLGFSAFPWLGELI
jgi:hypothetical protein